MNKTKKVLLQNILKTIFIPITVYLICEILSVAFCKEHLLANMLSVNIFLKNVCILTLAAFALSLNMTTGRMDFSLGAQQLFGCIVGGNFALQLGLGIWGVFAFSILFGAIGGLLTGILFVNLRVPSMVLGIGVAMILECVTFALFSSGIQYFGNDALTGISGTGFHLVVTGLVVVLFVILYGYTKFGYHYRAIRGKQRVAMSKGINVFKNCAICYMLAGALISLSGVFQIAYNGVMESAIGLTSVMVSFEALIPVMLAMFMQSFCNVAVAQLIAAICTRILTTFLTNMQLSAPVVSLITYTILFVFLSLMGMKDRSGVNKERALRRKEAIVLLNKKMQHE